MRSAALAVVLAGLAALPASASAQAADCRPAATPADGPAGLLHFVGAVHEHSAYSDGYPGSAPRDYYRSGRCFGLNFLLSGEHSDNLDLPIAASEECVPPASPAPCALSDTQQPQNNVSKWQAMAEQADAEQAPGYVTGRGFEWSSDRFGHINVYFSTHQVNAKIDGGYADMRAFYAWAARPPELGGGADGLMTFNHPGDKKLSTGDPGYNWNDFAHEPSVDDRMVGLEVFNGTKDYGSWYTRALDRGWHVGAVGAEDLGHERTDRWGADDIAKTVHLAPENSREAVKDALRDRRFYATLGRGLRLDFTVDDAVMGSRLDRPAGARLEIEGALREWAGGRLPGDVRLELVGNGGEVLDTGKDDLKAKLEYDGRVRWMYLRALRDGRAVAYSSPVWIEPAARAGEWLAGDLHVHSCFSHDVFCGPLDQPFQIEPGDDPLELAAEEVQYVTDPDNLEKIYAYGMTVGERFQEAAVRGLDYLAITDHNDTRSARARGFGSAGVLGIPGYENSVRGHAQVLGSRDVLDNGDGSAAAMNALIERLHERGGVFQANHPGYTVDSPFASCDQDPASLHWRYGYTVPVDTIEVWNPTSSVRDAEAYLECWLARGHRVGLTGGGDSHWKSLLAAQGAGNPTTWIHAQSRTSRHVLAALRAGRTSVSRLAPAQGGAPLLIEVRRADGTWTSAIGEEVAPGAALRVRSEGPAMTGVVTVRANGADIVTEQPLGPGQAIAFTAPAQGWVRARLHSAGEETADVPGCEHELGSNEKASSCLYDHSLVGMTSPAYVAPGG